GGAGRFMEERGKEGGDREAEGVNVDDRVALRFRQEKEGIKEIRLNGLRQFAAQIPRAFAQAPRCEMNLSGLNCFHAVNSSVSSWEPGSTQRRRRTPRFRREK